MCRVDQLISSNRRLVVLGTDGEAGEAGGVGGEKLLRKNATRYRPGHFAARQQKCLFATVPIARPTTYLFPKLELNLWLKTYFYINDECKSDLAILRINFNKFFCKIVKLDRIKISLHYTFFSPIYLAIAVELDSLERANQHLSLERKP